MAVKGNHVGCWELLPLENRLVYFYSKAFGGHYGTLHTVGSVFMEFSNVLSVRSIKTDLSKIAAPVNITSSVYYQVEDIKKIQPIEESDEQYENYHAIMRHFAQNHNPE